MNKSNMPNDGRDENNETIESITNAFLHLAKLVGDRHCNKILYVLLESLIKSARVVQSVPKVQGSRTNKSIQMEETWSEMAPKPNCISRMGQLYSILPRP